MHFDLWCLVECGVLPNRDKQKKKQKLFTNVDSTRVVAS